MPPPRPWERIVAGSMAFEDAHLTKLVWLLKDDEARGAGPLGRQTADTAVRAARQPACTAPRCALLGLFPTRSYCLLTPARCMYPRLPGHFFFLFLCRRQVRHFEAGGHWTHDGAPRDCDP